MQKETVLTHKENPCDKCKRFIDWVISMRINSDYFQDSRCGWYNLEDNCCVRYINV